MVKETAAGIWQVVGQVGLQQPVAVFGDQFAARRPAGRRHVRQQQRMVRVVVEQRLDQRLGSARFADRNDVQPEQALWGVLRIKTVAFAEMLQILRLLARSPRQAQPDKRLDEIGEA